MSPNPLAFHCPVHMEAVSESTLSINEAIHLLSLGQHSFLIFFFLRNHFHSQSMCLWKWPQLGPKTFSFSLCSPCNRVALMIFICWWHSNLFPTSIFHTLIHNYGKWMKSWVNVYRWHGSVSKTAMSQTRGRGKAFPRRDSETWQSPPVVQVQVLMNNWPVCVKTINHSFLLWDNCNLSVLLYRDVHLLIYKRNLPPLSYHQPNQSSGSSLHGSSFLKVSAWFLPSHLLVFCPNWDSDLLSKLVPSIRVSTAHCIPLYPTFSWHVCVSAFSSFPFCPS